MPRGKELWWTNHPQGKPYVVQDVSMHPEGGAIVTLTLSTSASSAPIPAVNTSACFSIHSTTATWSMHLPPTDPWPSPC